MSLTFDPKEINSKQRKPRILLSIESDLITSQQLRKYEAKITGNIVKNLKIKFLCYKMKKQQTYHNINININILIIILKQTTK